MLTAGVILEGLMVKIYWPRERRGFLMVRTSVRHGSSASSQSGGKRGRPMHRVETKDSTARGERARMSRILLVEDEYNVRVLLEHVLIDGGYEVDSAATVAEAKSLLDSVRYDLVLADGRLPDGTGMMLADLAEESGIKALIITGYAFQLAELGRYEFLMKPVRPAELVGAIERILGAPAC